MPNDTIGTEQLLPYERGDSPADVKKSLFAAVDSELSSEQPGEDEPAAEGDPKAPDAEPEDEPEEEPDDSDESDEDEGTEGDEDEGPDEDPLHEIIEDGQTRKITLKEALAGYQRQSDYTRGKVALAREKEQVQAEVQQARVARDQYAELIEAQALTLKRLQPKEPDWDKLREENPTQYAVLRADHQRFKDELREVEAEQRRVFEERSADFQKQQAAHLEEQKVKLYEAIPEWKDQVKEKTEKTKLADYLTGTYGWTQADLETVTDHRLMVALRKAMLYDEGQTKGKEKIQGKLKASTRPLRAGSRERVAARPEKKAAKTARQQLKRSGRAEDAAAYIATMLE